MEKVFKFAVWCVCVGTAYNIGYKIGKIDGIVTFAKAVLSDEKKED